MDRPFCLEHIIVQYPYEDFQAYIITYQLRKQDSKITLYVKPFIGTLSKLKFYIDTPYSTTSVELNELIQVLQIVYEDMEVIERLFTQQNYPTTIKNYLDALKEIG